MLYMIIDLHENEKKKYSGVSLCNGYKIKDKM